MTDIIKNADVAILQKGSIDLLVESYSDATRTLQIRGMTNAQNIAADITTSSDRSLVTSIIDISGVPIFLTARTSARAVQRGQLYVKVSLRVDGIVVALLMSGYVAETSKIAFPGGHFESSTDGPGFMKSVAGADPAAGVEIIQTVPAGAMWKIHSVYFTLVTDATVDTRHVRFIFDDGTTIFYQHQSSYAHPQSVTFPYCGSIVGAAAVTLQNMISVPLLETNRLLAGYRFRTYAATLKAGDNYGAPQFLVEEWINP